MKRDIMEKPTAKYIESGRFEYPTIWVHDLNPVVSYPRYFALNIGQSLDLWIALTRTLFKAGQGGTLDAGIKQIIKEA